MLTHTHSHTNSYILLCHIWLSFHSHLLYSCLTTNTSSFANCLTIYNNRFTSNAMLQNKKKTHISFLRTFTHHNTHIQVTIHVYKFCKAACHRLCVIISILSSKFEEKCNQIDSKLWDVPAIGPTDPLTLHSDCH